LITNALATDSASVRCQPGQTIDCCADHKAALGKRIHLLIVVDNEDRNTLFEPAARTAKRTFASSEVFALGQ
jgi:hypothetical protein